MSKNRKRQNPGQINHYQIMDRNTHELLGNYFESWPVFKKRIHGVAGIYGKRVKQLTAAERKEMERGLLAAERVAYQAYRQEEANGGSSYPEAAKALRMASIVENRREGFLALPEKLQLEEVAWEIVKIGPSAARQLFEDYFASLE